MFRSLRGTFAIFTAVVALGLALAANPGRAADFQHAQLKSTDGTEIRLDYQQGIFRDGYIVASPLWVHVSNPLLRPEDRVRVLLMVYDHGAQEQYEAVDLYYLKPGQFEGVLRGGLVIGREGHDFEEQLACVVSGRWLTDPINRTSNFQLTLRNN